MAINDITTQNWYAMYVKASQSNGNNIVDPTALYDESTGLITEADGDVFQVTGETVVHVKTDETEKPEEILEEIVEAGDVNETDNTVTNEEIEKLRAEISNLEAQKASNEQQIDSLDKKIESLKKEAQNEIDKAIQESEALTEDQETAASQVIAEQLKKYTDADGEMSYDEFQQNTASALGELDSKYNTKMQNAFNKLMSAENKLQSLDVYLQTFGVLNQRNKDLINQIDEKNTALNTAIETEEARQVAAKKDPIGFFDSEGNRYDFFVDEDKNGQLSNENEFLGAEDNWSEMIALDADKDGSVSTAELADSNIKMVVINKDGNQEVKEIFDVFKDTDSVDLNSYKESGTELENGNILLGSFSMTLQGETIDDAYNTLDSLEWLNENYTFSDKAEKTGRFAEDYKSVNAALGFDIDERLEQHTEDVTLIRENLTKSWLTLGIDRNELKEIIDENKNNVDKEAKELSVKFAEIKQLEEQAQVDEEQEINELELEKEARKTELMAANPDMTETEIEALLAEEFPEQVEEAVAA